MANKDNSCSNLEILNLKFEQWDLIFEKQKELQKRLGYNFEGMTLHQISNFWLFNKHALEDELSEMMDSLGGINDGIGSALWKKWKKDNELGHSMDMSSLSFRDKRELLFEIVDAFHFMINFSISVGFTGTDVANAYLAKNQENHNRQENNY